MIGARAHTLACVAAAAALAAQARAADVKLGVELGVDYDTNPLATDKDPQADVDFFVGPRLEADDETGTFRWDLRYSPKYRRYLDLSELDGWDQDAYGSMTWKLSPRTTLSMSERYLDYRNFDQIVSSDLLPNGVIDTGFSVGREELRQNAITATIEHQPGERHLIAFEIDRYDNRFKRPDLDLVTKSNVTAATASYYYTLFKTDSIGAALGATRQQIQNPDDFNTDYINLSLLWKHAFGPTWLLDASAGPVWTRQDPVDTLKVQRNQFLFPRVIRADGSVAPIHALTCPTFSDGTHFLGLGCQPFAPGEGNLLPSAQVLVTDLPRQGDLPGHSTSWTYFANISLTKSWESSQLVFRYSRDVSNTTEVAGTVRDNFSVTYSWAMTPRWHLGLFAYYETREDPVGNGVVYRTVVTPLFVQLGQTAGSDAAVATAFRPVHINTDFVKTQTYLGAFYLTYQWSERIQIVWSGQYTSESIKDPILDNRKVNRFRTAIGVTYWLPTFQLPI